MCFFFVYLKVNSFLLLFGIEIRKHKLYSFSENKILKQINDNGKERKEKYRKSNKHILC